MNGLMQEKVLSEKDRADIDKEMRFLWFLWTGVIGCPIATMIMCHIVAYQMGENIPVRSNFPLGVLEIVLSVVGLLLLVIAYFLRRLFSMGRWEMFKEGSIKATTTTNKPVYLLLYRANVYIPMAIPASLGIYGMVLFMFGADVWG